MRTLERIKLHHYEGINESEQKGMKGGGDDIPLVWSDEFGCYMLPEVYVDAPKPECKACKNFEQTNNPHGLQGGDRTNNAYMTPLGEYIWKEFILDHSPSCAWYDK